MSLRGPVASARRASLQGRLEHRSAETEGRHSRGLPRAGTAWQVGCAYRKSETV
jgi:hypothetical protein